jgi:hypothetical protein
MNQIETLRSIATKASELADLLGLVHDTPNTSPPNNEPAVEKPAVVYRQVTERTDELCRANRNWTDEEKQQVLTLHNIGVDHQEIARVMKRTPQAIYNRLFHWSWGLLRENAEDDEGVA